MWTKIKNWLFPTSEEEEEEDDIPYLIVWGVIEGPFTEYGELSEEDEDVPYYNVCKVSVDGEVFTTEIYFDSFESAYNLKRHFDKYVEPIYIPLGEF
jgi:hypothetical protein